MKRNLVLLAAIAMLAIPAVVPAVGATATWNVDGDGVWNTTALNWWNGSAPTVFYNDDHVVFSDLSVPSATITVDSAGVVPYTMTADSSSTGYTIDASSGSVTTDDIYKSGSGKLTLEGDYSLTGYNGIAVSGGELELKGTLIASGPYAVGYHMSGNGSLTLDSGSYCEIGDYGVAADGTGTLTVKNDATLSLNSFKARSANTVVESGGSIQVVGSTTIGYDGSGSLSIESGGSFEASTGTYNFEASNGGTVTVEGELSVDTNRAYFRDDGHLVVQNGGTVDITAYRSYAYCPESDTDGAVVVDGTGSTLNITSTGSYVYFRKDSTITNDGIVVKNGGYLGISTHDADSYTYIKGYDISVESGATFAASEIRFRENSNSGIAGAIYLDGGTLKALDADNADWIYGYNADALLTAVIEAKSGGATFDTNGYNMGSEVVISGVGGITKTGAGTLTLTAANTYAGVAAVSQGPLVLGPSAHNAAFNLGGADVQSNGVLAFDYTGGSTPITTVRGSLFSGKIYSSDATTSHGLGYADDGSSQVHVEYAIYGDSDLDGDVDVNDLMNGYGNYNGAGGTGKVWADNDFDYDGDVDVNDLMDGYGNYTGAGTATMTALLLGNSPDVADLIYDPTTGNVTLDAGEGIITGFSLENAPGGDDFNTGVAVFPFSTFQDDLSTAIANFDMTGAGFTGEWNLGNIFVAGLDEASLSAWLTTANYSSSIGSPVQAFDLTVVPEPSTLALLACSLIGLLAYAWRKRR